MRALQKPDRRYTKKKHCSRVLHWQRASQRTGWVWKFKEWNQTERKWEEERKRVDQFKTRMNAEESERESASGSGISSFFGWKRNSRTPLYDSLAGVRIFIPVSEYHTRTRMQLKSSKLKLFSYQQRMESRTNSHFAIWEDFHSFSPQKPVSRERVEACVWRRVSAQSVSLKAKRLHWKEPVNRLWSGVEWFDQKESRWGKKGEKFCVWKGSELYANQMAIYCKPQPLRHHSLNCYSFFHPRIIFCFSSAAFFLFFVYFLLDLHTVRIMDW